MSRLINIGFGNAVNTDKVVAVVSPLASPVKRMVSSAKAEGSLIDATQGRKTKSVLVMENGRLVLSALQPDTIMKRFNDKNSSINEERTETQDE
ncbi:MAG: DUF370 domain-containing protein [Eubacteriales bacterium]|nr:DUF370 domain-containing protein [Eubacteriales bacterium]